MRDVVRYFMKLLNCAVNPGPRDIEKRPAISDEEFHHLYYSASDVTPETCRIVRHVLCVQLRHFNALPSDNVAVLFDVDVGEICFEVSEEIGQPFPKTLVSDLDGTVDSLIRATQQLVDSNGSVDFQQRE